MKEILISALVGSIIGSLITHCFILRREGRERRRKFRAVVELIRFEIEATSKGGIWDAHHNSIGRLQEHAAHVLSDIRCDRREAFRENLIKYSKLTSESLRNFVNADPITLSPQYEAAVASIIDPLAKLIELADGHRGDFWLASRANKAASADSRER
jgi:hypothetical protein